jgi:hypothetical protein
MLYIKNAEERNPSIHEAYKRTTKKKEKREQGNQKN